MNVVAVIPARFASSRFPGKPLARIKEKPMIQHVYERVKNCKRISEVIIATDHYEIINVVHGFGGRAIMTRSDHESGSDRIAEVAEKIEGDIFINIQGDEPLIKSELIDEILSESKRNIQSVITAKTKITNKEDVDSPNTVKVVTDYDKNALYFSRSTIPHNRSEKDYIYYKHIGIYCYPREILKQYVNLPKSTIEQMEMLEQLRLLENNYNIRVVETDYDSIGVDVPGDVDRIEKILGGN